MCHNSPSLFLEVFLEVVHQTGVKDEKSWKYPLSHDPEISIISCLGLMIIQGFEMYLAAHVFLFFWKIVFFLKTEFPKSLISMYIYVVAFFLDAN